jgi:hypothetical protein
MVWEARLEFIKLAFTEAETAGYSVYLIMMVKISKQHKILRQIHLESENKMSVDMHALVFLQVMPEILVVHYISRAAFHDFLYFAVDYLDFFPVLLHKLPYLELEHI